MKRNLFASFAGIVLTCLLLFNGNVFAQFTSGKDANANIKDNDELVYTFEGALDTLGSADSLLTSSSFSFKGYQDNDHLTLAYFLTATSGTPAVKITLLRSEDNSNFAAQSSADTLVSSASTEGKWVYVSVSVQGLHSEYYKLKIENLATSPDGQAFKARLKATKKNYPTPAGYTPGYR